MNFVHFAISTPVINYDVRLTIVMAFVPFNSDPGVEVTDVLVFDGPKHVRLNRSMAHGVSGELGGSRGQAEPETDITAFSVNPAPVF